MIPKNEMGISMFKLSLGHLIETVPCSNWPSSFLEVRISDSKKELGIFMFKLSLAHSIERAPSTNWPSSFLKFRISHSKKRTGKIYV